MNSFITDLFNGFSPREIPFFIFQLANAVVLSVIILAVVNRSWKLKTHGFYILAAVIVAFIAGLAEFSIPFSIIGGALVVGLFLSGQNAGTNTNANLLPLCVLTGFGMGTGFVVITWITFFIIVLPILLFFRTEK
jgi:hypothetical protein